jgi:probable F420-dependent oxidoreductase
VHPFRFVVHTGGGHRADDWPVFARRVEELGYHALYVVDHLGQQLAPIAALATAAAATSTLRLGSYVFANDFRHPLILAREAATVDRLSGGRLDLGIGAGWMRSDYRQLGMAYDAPGRRIDRLVESLDVLDRLFAGETVTHHGPSYTLDRAKLFPMPIQRPRPPLLIGGGGPRLLGIAARRAEIIGLAPQMTVSGRPMARMTGDDAVATRVAIVREAAGSRFEALELNAFVADAGVVGGGPIGATLAAWLKSAGPAAIGGSPYLLYGTITQLRESLLRRRNRMGISSYGIPARAMDALAPLVESLAGR